MLLIREVVQHPADEERPLLRGIFDGVVTAELTELYRADLQEQCRIMHGAAKRKAFTCIGVMNVPDVWFGDDPFEGPHGFQSGETRVKS